MDQSKINIRYARAFFSLAKDKGLLSALREDAALITNVCETSNDFILLIESPVVKTSQKVKAITSIFAGKINVLSLNFLVLITENNRAKNIPDIFRSLEAIYLHESGVKTAVLTTASAMNELLMEQVRQKLEKEFSAKVELTQKVNDELIGGFVLRIDDKQYDASVSTHLKKIREQLLQTELK